MREEKLNFFQVGRTLACGHCDPDTFGRGLAEAEKNIPNYKCECVCHDPEPSYSKDNNKVIQMTTLKGERNRIIHTLRTEIELQVWQEMLEIVGKFDVHSLGLNYNDGLINAIASERSRIRTIVEEKIKKIKE